MEMIKIKSSYDLSEVERLLKNTDAEITEILTDWIYKNYYPQMIKSVLNENFEDFSEEEQEDIILRSTSLIEEKELKALKSIIQNKLTEYFKNESGINIDGFVNFRLQELKDRLFLIAEEATYEYMALSEYSRLVDLLNYLDEFSNNDDY